jgi:hypothetical protein
MRVRSLRRLNFATAQDGIEYFAIPVPRIWSVADRIRSSLCAAASKDVSWA